MITDLIIRMFGAVAHAVMSALPTLPVPDWLSSADGAIATVFGVAGSMGAWVPVTLLGTVLAAVLAAWAVGFSIKGARIVLSLLTLGGGSAA